MGLLWEIKRYVKHPLCLLRHKKLDPNEIATDGQTLDYYCWRCQKVLKRVPVKDSLDYVRLANLFDEVGDPLSWPKEQ